MEESEANESTSPGQKPAEITVTKDQSSVSTKSEPKTQTEKEQILRIAVFGPPCVGKSTAIGHVALAASKGIIKSTHCLDLECFHSETDESIEFMLTVLSKLSSSKSNVLIAMNGFPYERVPNGFLKVLILPSKEKYLERYNEKAKMRGIPTGRYHTPNEILSVYDSFYEKRDQFTIISDSEEVIGLFSRVHSETVSNTETKTAEKETISIANSTKENKPIEPEPILVDTSESDNKSLEPNSMTNQKYIERILNQEPAFSIGLKATTTDEPTLLQVIASEEKRKRQRKLSSAPLVE